MSKEDNPPPFGCGRSGVAMVNLEEVDTVGRNPGCNGSPKTVASGVIPSYTTLSTVLLGLIYIYRYFIYI